MFTPRVDRPFHLVVLPDGGRRWAQRTGCSLEEAYRVSADRIAAFLELAFRAQVDIVSVSASTAENQKRTAGELKAIESALVYFREYHEPKLIETFNCKVCYVDTLNVQCNESSKHSFLSGRKRVSIYTNYSASAELDRACAKALTNAEAVSSRTILDNLLERESVDATFRSGGFPTLGNFLPLVMGYARHFCDERMFNDIDPVEILECVNRLMERPVYFGGATAIYGEIKY